MTNTPFIRTAFTWQNYFLLGYYAGSQAIIGLVMPFIRDELAMSFSLTGFHMSAFALGVILSSLRSDWFVQTYSIRQVFWSSSFGMWFGLSILILGRHPAMTISGAFIMGLLGCLLLIAIQAYLAQAHPQAQATALTEANVIASIGATVAPLLIGGLIKLNFGWRAILPLVLLSWVLPLLVFSAPRQEELQADASQESKKSAALPPIFWVYTVITFAMIAVEWCMIFWGALFLENEVGMSKSQASAGMSLFFGAIILGRILGSWLTRRFKSQDLLIGAMLIILLGFPLLWWAISPALSLIGLFIAGLGVANLYPMTLSTALALVPGQADSAGARIATLGGLAMLTMPQLLGFLADRMGLQWAYGIVLFWLILGLGISLSIQFFQKNNIHAKETL